MRISDWSSDVCSSDLLAQAVQILANEWFQAADATPPAQLALGETRSATKAELLFFLERLEGELDACGFLNVPEKRPTMVRNIRNIFQRLSLTDQALTTLHGIVSGLVHARGTGGGRYEARRVGNEGDSTRRDR